MKGGVFLSFASEREKAGVSQAAVAKELGITGAAVCQWEKGKTSPKLPMLRKIAKLYGCSVDALVENTEDREDPVAKI